eukprot:7408728-Ditylum_brightwellii.AAC.1
MTTKLNTLKGKLKNQGGSNSSKQSSGLSGGNNANKDGKLGNKNKQNNGPPEWRTKFKGQKYTHNGKEFIWCKEHK